MEEKTEINAVELVRAIRDRQAESLSGKSNEEIIAFFRQAREAARGGILSPDWAAHKKMPEEIRKVSNSNQR